MLKHSPTGPLKPPAIQGVLPISRPLAYVLMVCDTGSDTWE